MNQEKRNIDDLFRDNLEGYLPEQPSGGVWKAVAKAMFWKNIKRGLIKRWYYALLLLLLCTGGSYFMLSNVFTGTSGLMSQTPMPENTNESVAQGAQPTDQSIAFDSRKTEEPSNTKKEQKQKTSELYSSVSSKASSGEEIMHSTSATSLQTNSTDESQQNSLIETAKPVSIAPVANPEAIEEASLEVAVDSYRKKDKKNMPEAFEFPEEEVQSMQKRAGDPLMVDYREDENPGRRQHNTIANHSAKVQTNSFIEVTGGLSQSFMSQQFSNPLTIETVQLNDESPVLGNIGVLTGLKFKYFTFKTGLNYLQYGENVKWENDELVLDSTVNSYWVDKSYWKVDTVDWYVDPLDPSITYPILSRTFIEDSLLQNDIHIDSSFAQQHYQARNRYQMIELPLLAGFEKQWGRINVNIYTGLGVAWLYKAQGSIYDYTLFENIALAADHKAFANRISFSFMLQAGVGYQFAQRWQVQLQPAFRQTLSPLWKDAALKRNYRNWGLNVGLRYAF